VQDLCSAPCDPVGTIVFDRRNTNLGALVAHLGIISSESSAHVLVVGGTAKEQLDVQLKRGVRIHKEEHAVVAQMTSAAASAQPSVGNICLVAVRLHHRAPASSSALEAAPGWHDCAILRLLEKLASGALTSCCCSFTIYCHCLTSLCRLRSRMRKLCLAD
jgi:hypothetical protein